MPATAEATVEINPHSDLPQIESRHVWREAKEWHLDKYIVRHSPSRFDCRKPWILSVDLGHCVKVMRFATQDEAMRRAEEIRDE